MFETLAMAPPDAILGLNEAFKKDPHPEKINLSVGVYQDDQGKTPILACVKEAETQLLAGEANKSYLGIDGLPEFSQAARELLFGPEHELVASPRSVSVQTPGGTGALRVAAEFLKNRLAAERIWCTKPTWANHPHIFRSSGLDVQEYPYLDPSRTGLDFASMTAALEEIPPGDVLCLHACCHNPTGIDPTPEQWRTIGEIVRARQLLPLIDFAYQGFGKGLDEDAAGLRTLVDAQQELVICSSYSKNFGLYGERVGAMTVVAGDESAAQASLSHIKSCIRGNYSNPPKHGAAIVATVLADAGLRSQWESEVAAMRDRINGMRRRLVEELQAKGVQQDFSFISRQLGMFSFSGLTPMQVDQLRNEHSIYIVGSGRINVAGITEANIGRLCDAIKAVLA